MFPSIESIANRIISFLLSPLESAYSGVSGAGAELSIPVAPPGSGGKKVFINKIICSYSAAPSGGGLEIHINGVTKWRVDITAAGEHIIPLGITGPANATLDVVLLEGGGSVVGKLNIIGGVL